MVQTKEQVRVGLELSPPTCNLPPSGLVLQSTLKTVLCLKGSLVLYHPLKQGSPIQYSVLKIQSKKRDLGSKEKLSPHPTVSQARSPAPCNIPGQPSPVWSGTG